MRKIILFSFLFIIGFATLNAQWSLEDVLDNFGDKTGEKYIMYKTTGTQSNKPINVVLKIKSPSALEISAINGKTIYNLNSGIFSYKIDELKIDDVGLLGGKFTFDNLSINEKTSLMHLLKQGKIINVLESTYWVRFNINANGFVPLLNSLYKDKPVEIEYKYNAPDQNGELMHIYFTLKYPWSINKEKLLTDSLENIVKNFFAAKNVQYVLDSQGYYQKEKIDKEWGLPLFKQIENLLEGPVELVSFSAGKKY